MDRHTSRYKPNRQYFRLQYLERAIDASMGKITPVLCIQTYNHVQKYFPGCLAISPGAQEIYSAEKVQKV